MRIRYSICRATLMGMALCAALSCAAQRPGVGSPAVGAATSTPASPAAGEVVAQLARLRAQRTSGHANADYVVGEGDLLSIKAMGLDELTQKVRVDGSGAISLPLLDTVKVGGRTVAQVQQDLNARLGEFMYQPHVDVFVEEYRSQQIAVVGAVQRPGLVAETGKGMTVLDAISAAGGMTLEAAGRIYLIPAESRTPENAQAVALAMRGNGASGSEQALRDAAPITVNMDEVGQDAQAMLFSMPVHGGDVLIVPAKGRFIVQGYVNNPGPYPLTSSLTLRGALASAGGLSFPANATHVRIHRPAPGGTIEMLDVDYAAVAARKAPEVFIRDSDVIEVPASVVKVIPYSIGKTILDVVRVGARVGIGL
jgi:polysaccharide export outer membrane protein